MTMSSSFLPETFQPSDFDIIVGRGKVCYRHAGNLRLNRMVASVLNTYSSPEATKKSKSDLIKQIMAQIRASSSHGGGFVKKDLESGRWFEVSEAIAREKISQCFRDALNDRYKSSTTSKTLKRRQERINKMGPGDVSPILSGPIKPMKKSAESVVSAALKSIQQDKKGAAQVMMLPLARPLAAAFPKATSPLLATIASLPQRSVNPLSIHRCSAATAVAATNLKLLAVKPPQQQHLQSSSAAARWATMVRLNPQAGFKATYLGSSHPSVTSSTTGAVAVNSLMAQKILLSRELLRQRQEASPAPASTLPPAAGVISDSP